MSFEMRALGYDENGKRVPGGGEEGFSFVDDTGTYRMLRDPEDVLTPWHCQHWSPGGDLLGERNVEHDAAGARYLRQRWEDAWEERGYP